MGTSKKEALQVLEFAYQETAKRAASNWQPIISTKIQLKYCIDALLDKNDRSRLKDIMFSQYIIHEFEQQDFAFAELLHEASAVVRLMIDGEL